jgi:hypothetical protein
VLGVSRSSCLFHPLPCGADICIMRCFCLLLQLDREKQAEAVLQELASIISRYRGPLLESSVDLEQRLWHLATMTGEVRQPAWGPVDERCWQHMPHAIGQGTRDRTGDSCIDNPEADCGVGLWMPLISGTLIRMRQTGSCQSLAVLPPFGGSHGVLHVAFLFLTAVV